MVDRKDYPIQGRQLHPDDERECENGYDPHARFERVPWPPGEQIEYDWEGDVWWSVRPTRWLATCLNCRGEFTTLSAEPRHCVYCGSAIKKEQREELSPERRQSYCTTCKEHVDRDGPHCSQCGTRFDSTVTTVRKAVRPLTLRDDG